MTRISGLATGLDVDAVVKETMQAYQSQIDSVKKDKMILELQQEMYRDVIKDCRNFYDNYFDMSKQDSIMLQKNWTSTSFESSNSAVASATATGNATAANYDIKVVQLASPASITIAKDDLAEDIEINGVKISFNSLSADATVQDKVNYINKRLAEENKTDVKAKYSEFSKGIVIETKESGSTQKLKVENGSDTINESGKDCIAQITNSRNESYNYIGKTNNVTVDGVKFSFTGTNATGNSNPDGSITINSVTSEVKLTGKNDTGIMKDKIVKFVDDYNKLMIKLNTLTTEKRYRDYKPLTEEEKSDMTEKQIELWEKKVKSGQLRNDSDLVRIRDGMKNAMSNLVGNSKNSLVNFGIKSVADYSGTKNGTFTIDESALENALENNMDDMKSFFVSTGATSKEQGVLTRLKNLFDNETQKSSSALLKKAGIEGSSTVSNNLLTQKITKYEDKISRMQNLFSTKQQALYTKYASLETIMNNLNAQMNSLTSMFSS